MLGNVHDTTSDKTDFGQFTLFHGEDIEGRHAMSDFFLQYWQERGGQEKTFSRADVKPTELKRYLDRVVLMDVVNDGPNQDLVVRLIGSWVESFYGAMTGKPISAMKNHQASARIYAASGETLQQEAPVLSLTPALAENRTHLEATALYLPIFEDGEIKSIMVAVDITSKKSVLPEAQ